MSSARRIMLLVSAGMSLTGAGSTCLRILLPAPLIVQPVAATEISTEGKWKLRLLLIVHLLLHERSKF